MVNALLRGNVSLGFRIAIVVLGLLICLALRIHAAEPSVRAINSSTHEPDRDRRARVALALSSAESDEVKTLTHKPAVEALLLDWTFVPCTTPHCPCGDCCQCPAGQCSGRCPAPLPPPPVPDVLPVPMPEARPQPVATVKPDPVPETVYYQTRDQFGRTYYAPVNGDANMGFYPATGSAIYPGCQSGFCPTCANGRCGR